MIGSGASSIPGIDDPLEVVAHAQGEASLGDGLTDDELVQVGNQGLGGWDRGETGFLGGSLRGRGWLWNGLGSDLGEGSGCAEGADACRRIEAAFKESDVVIEAKGTARAFVGHTDTRAGGTSRPPTMGGRSPHSMVSDTFRISAQLLHLATA